MPMTGPNGSTASPLPELQPQLQARRFDNPVFALGLAVNDLMTKPAFARLFLRPLGARARRPDQPPALLLRLPRPDGRRLRRLGARRAARTPRSGSRASRTLAPRGRPHRRLHHSQCLGRDDHRREQVPARRDPPDGQGQGDRSDAEREYPDGRSRPLRLSVNDFVESHLAETGQQSGAAAKPAGEP